MDNIVRYANLLEDGRLGSKWFLKRSCDDLAKTYDGIKRAVAGDGGKIMRITTGRGNKRVSVEVPSGRIVAKAKPEESKLFVAAICDVLNVQPLYSGR